MPMSHLESLEPIARDVVAAEAVSVDRVGAFPDAAVRALGDAGLLGLLSAAEVGGRGRGLRAAVEVVTRLARECASTAMVVTMHYAGASVLERFGSEDVRRAIAEGRHLSTLALSESGSRSHFWSPVGTATKQGSEVVLEARKSFVTSARHAAAYVWSSKPVASTEASTLWLVPRTTPGLEVPSPFDGLGLRGNDSAPVHARGVRVTESARLGADGEGFAIMMEVVLPAFNLMSAGVSVGIMESATARTAAHAGDARFAHLGSSLAELPTVRANVARMRILTDMASCLLQDAIAAVEVGRSDAMLRVLESKAAAAEASLEVVQLAMRVTAGAAYRREIGVERHFRDAQAATAMAPTTDVLYDFVGKAATGLPHF